MAWKGLRRSCCVPGSTSCCGVTSLLVPKTGQTSHISPSPPRTISCTPEAMSDPPGELRAIDRRARLRRELRPVVRAQMLGWTVQFGRQSGDGNVIPGRRDQI